MLRGFRCRLSIVPKINYSPQTFNCTCKCTIFFPLQACLSRFWGANQGQQLRRGRVAPKWGYNGLPENEIHRLTGLSEEEIKNYV
jgi:hypothetical protein